MPRESFYISLVKKARKFLRSKLMLRVPWLRSKLKPLFHRSYWIPTHHRAALGLSIGLFFSFAFMLLPIQTLGAALCCLYIRANLPIALGACWITNPFTIPFLIKPIEWCGSKFAFLGIDAGHYIWSVPGVDVKVNLVDLLIGCLAMGIILSVSAYPFYRFISLFFTKKLRIRRDS